MNDAVPQRIELGVVVAGRLDQLDRDALDASSHEILRQLRSWFPEFVWSLDSVRREDWSRSRQVEPTDLLQQAREERDERGWDFVFVVTGGDLVSHYKPFALAIISRTLDSSIISTARIDPRATDVEKGDAERSIHLQANLRRLMLHLIGHWLGLGHDADPNNIMLNIDSVAALPAGTEFSATQVDDMRSALHVVADQRIEERADVARTSSLRFLGLSVWENRQEIFDAVVQARPWEFPMRLGRLTTAAVSTVLVLLMTGETWDMAMSQNLTTVTGLFLFAMASTTGYVAHRQQLLLRRSGRELSEQIVTSNVSAAVIVLTGMFVMFLVLYVLTLVAAWFLFPYRVVEGWAASLHEVPKLGHYLRMAGTVGSLGIMIGALGASFEQHHYFRHVVFVDEEV